MGIFLLAGSAVRLGFMADFFSKPLLLGYLNGIALTIIASRSRRCSASTWQRRDFFAIVAEIAGDSRIDRGALPAQRRTCRGAVT